MIGVDTPYLVLVVAMVLLAAGMAISRGAGDGRAS